MPKHSVLTGADLHEPKGVAAATSGQVYVADGAASGAWQKIGTSEIDTSEIQNLNTFFMQVVIADISTAESILVPVPKDCSLVKATSVLENAITVADANISFDKNGTLGMGTDMTVEFTGSAKGDIDTFTPAANADLDTATDYLEIATDGGSTTAARLWIVLEFTYD